MSVLVIFYYLGILFGTYIMRQFIVFVLMLLSIFISLGVMEAAGQGMNNDTINPGMNMRYHPSLKTWIRDESTSASHTMSGEASSNHATCGCFSSSPSKRTRDVTIVKSHDFPGNWMYARDAAWDGSNLWIGENFNCRIYQMDPDTGSILSSFFGPDLNQWGLAWDGTHLKSAQPEMQQSPPGDPWPDWVYTLTIGGTNLYKWELPTSTDATPHGLAYDPVSGSLWLSDSYHAKIYELDPQDGQIRSSYLFVGSDPRGLAWDGTGLWAIDNSTQLLYKMDSGGNVVDMVSIDTLGNDPEGLTWDGQYLWVIENENDKIYQIDIGQKLECDPKVLSARTGGTVDFILDAGSENAHRNYLLLGSVTGTEPGFSLPGGEILPLNWDAFTDTVLALANTPLFANFMGGLDMMGREAAQLNAPPIDPQFVGVNMHYAFCVNNPFDFVSNPVEIEIIH